MQTHRAPHTGVRAGAVTVPQPPKAAQPHQPTWEGQAGRPGAHRSPWRQRPALLSHRLPSSCWPLTGSGEGEGEGRMLTSWLGGLTLWAPRAPSQADSTVPLPGPTAQLLGSQQIGGQELGAQIRQESSPWMRGGDTVPGTTLIQGPASHGAKGAQAEQRTRQRAKAQRGALFHRPREPRLSRGDASGEAAGEGLPRKALSSAQCTHSEPPLCSLC